MDNFSALPALQRRVKEGLERPYLIENGRSSTLRELAVLSVSIERLLEGRSSSAYLGIGFKSGSALIASMFYAWRKKRVPVLLDPDSPTDAARLLAIRPDSYLIWDRECPTINAESILYLSELVEADGVRDADYTDIIFPADEEIIVGFLTSGSTGEPKVVLKRGYQIYKQIKIVPELLQLPSPFRSVCMVPFYHILGFLYGIWTPLCHNGTVIKVNDQLPSAIRDIIISESPDFVVGTAVNYRMLEGVLEPDHKIKKATFISSGAPLDWKVGRDFAAKTGSEILELYGSTETGGCAHRNGMNNWQTYPGVEFRIESDTCRLWIRSPWSETPQTWYASHDLAEPVGGGFKLLGRDGSLAKIGGKRFSTLEVEEALKSHPDVNEAIVLISERYNDEPALHAFVVSRPGTELSLAQLRSFLTEKLAHFKIPRSIHLRTELPRTKLNKVNYAVLKNELEGLR